MADWREQFIRMVRWKARLWLDPILHKEHAIDSFYAFAAACYHLIDWLDNDHSQPIRRAQAKAYVLNSDILSLCGDICIGSKHAQLAPRKVRTKSEKTTQTVHIGEETGDITVEQTHLFVEWQGQYVDVEGFAAACIQTWLVLLRSEGLASADLSELTEWKGST